MFLAFHQRHKPFTCFKLQQARQAFARIFSSSDVFLGEGETDRIVFAAESKLRFALLDSTRRNIIHHQSLK